MNHITLTIHTFPDANPTVRRHWPYYEKAGADKIILITTNDGGCEVPPGVTHEMIGPSLYIRGRHLPSRLLRTFEHLISFTKSDWFAVAEYDTLWFKPIPRDLPLGLTSHLAGGKMPGSHCNFFCHNPWIVDRDTACKIVDTGNEILHSGNFDPSPDLFIGHVAEVAGIKVHTDILKSYSRNTIHAPWDDEALAAIRAGAVCVHGVKTPDVFQKLTAL